MKCPDCREEIKQGDLYCTHCGRKIDPAMCFHVPDGGDVPSDNSKTTKEEPAMWFHVPEEGTGAADTDIPHRTEARETVTYVRETPPPKPPRKGGWLAAVLVLVVAGLAAGFLHDDLPEEVTEGTTEYTTEYNEDYIRQGMNTLIEDEEFRSAERDEQGERIEEYLVDSVHEGRTDGEGNTIVEDSIERDEGSGTCIYTDSAGGINIVQYEVDNSYMNETAELRKAEPRQELTDVKGIMLYGLDEPGSKTATDSISIVNNLEEQGAECEIDDDVTVDDYKTKLDGYDFVIINTHGNMINYGYGMANASSSKVPVLCTEEDITTENMARYDRDIKEQRIAKVTIIDNEETGETAWKYWIMPSFFLNYYSDNALKGSYVHLGSCYGLGGTVDTEAGSDYELANAFISCGASAVTGYYNSVFTYYDFSLISEILKEMLSDRTLGQGVEAAQKQYGYDDREYAQQQGWLSPGSPNLESALKKLEKGVAHIIIAGDSNMKLRGQKGADNGAVAPAEPASIVGTWVDLKQKERVETNPNYLWFSYIRFNDDGTGVIAESGGAIDFTYVMDGPDTVVCTEFTGNVFTGKIVGDTMTLEGNAVYSDLLFTYQGIVD